MAGYRRATTRRARSVRAGPGAGHARTSRNRPADERLLFLQRQAGNAAVARAIAGTATVQRACECGGKCESCGGHEDERAAEGSVQRTLDSDFIVHDKNKDHELDAPNRLFFDFAKTTLDDEELGKVPPLAVPVDADLDLHGFASEEGGSSKTGPNAAVIRKRMDHVSAELQAAGHQGTRKEISHLGESTGRADYRSQRVVEVTGAGGKASSADCTPKPDCEQTFLQEIGAARAAVQQSIAALLSDPSEPKTAAALQGAFKATDNKTAAEAARGLSAIADELDFAATPPGHACKTNCDPVCKSAAAFVDRETRLMVLCPGFGKQTLITAPELLIHESAHAALGLQAADKAYVHLRLSEFITTEAALKNADSYMLFTRLITTGERGATPDATTVSGGLEQEPAAVQLEVRKSLAWAEDAIQRAKFSMLSNYDQANKARKAGKWLHPGHAELMRFLAPRFEMRGPINDERPVPREEDVWKISGIADRYQQLDHTFSQDIDVGKRDAPGAAWAPGPGDRVEVGPDVLAADLDGKVRALVKALVLADPGVSAARKQHFVDLVFKLIELRGQDRSATEGAAAVPITAAAGGGRDSGDDDFPDDEGFPDGQAQTEAEEPELAVA